MKPYYQDSSVSIYLGDCREILPTLGQFDLCLTDPPYGTEDVGGGYGRRQNHNPTGRVSRGIANDKDLTVATEGLRLASAQIPFGYIAAFCSSRKLREAVTMVDGEFVGEIVWDKCCPGLGYYVRYCHETCLLWAMGEPEKPKPPVMSLWRGHVARVKTEVRHPHDKPTSFWGNLMRLPGKRIIDPFCGSGSVLRQAKDMGRESVGIEVEERWAEASAIRMQQERLL